MLKLKFFDSSSSYGTIKATIHKTGKLGFSTGANKYMKLKYFKNFKIARNESDMNDDSLYLLPLEIGDENSYKLSKAGNYYYINIKSILKEMNIDYQKESIIYDIEKMEYEDSHIFRLTKRE